MSNQDTPHTEIPSQYRTFVYLVGSLGFPIVIAAYIMIVTTADVKRLEKEVASLSTRIDERPMGLDKTTDFIIYTTDSLRAELREGIPALCKRLNYRTDATPESLSRSINIIDREVEAYLRPIVRRHIRFTQRFPSVGGNLGSFFVLTAPAENITASDTEGYLTGETAKDFSESLSALINNNILGFGDSRVKAIHKSKEESGMADILRMLGGETPDAEPEIETAGQAPADGGSFDIISAGMFENLTLGAIDTACTALRDQMMERVRLQSSDLGNKK